MGGMSFTSRMMNPGAWDAWVVLTWVVVAVLVLAVAAAVAWALRDRRPAAASSAARQSPGDILDERFARGEISDEELQRRRRGAHRSMIFPGFSVVPPSVTATAAGASLDFDAGLAREGAV